MNKQPQTISNEQPGMSGSLLFGGIEFTHEDRIEFPFGLPGFEVFTKFLISTLPEYPPFCILQSEEAADISMLLLEAKMLTIQEKIMIPEKELKKVDIQKDEDAKIFFILKVNHSSHELTANVRAPLVVNLNSRKGFQAILDDTSLPLEYSISKGMC